jgi:tripartite-type tricarboxylate transporter receptor subunit TctC
MPSPAASTLPWPRTVAHADMDAFYAAVEQMDDPSLRGRPILVGSASNRGVVLTASYEARPFGVGSAMPMARARKLCPQALVVPPRFARYREISATVMRTFGDFSPHVEAISLDEAFLDMTGAERIFGPPAVMGRKLKDAVRDATGLAVTVGISGKKYVAKVASSYMKPDGLTISHLQWDAPQKEFLGVPGVKYRSLDFEWLGLANSSVITVAVRPDAPIKTIDEWLDPKTPKLIFGCTSVGSLPCDMVLAVNDIFGPISEIATGYLSLTVVRTAIFRKEVDALTGWTWDSVKAVGLELIEKGDLKLLAYIGQSRHPELDARKVPYLNDRVKRPEDRALLDILAMPATMVRPWAAPPKTPKNRLEVLRKAFLDVTKDPEFLAEAERLKVEIDPRTGEWLEEFLRKSKESLTAEVRNRARKILGME